MENGGQNGMHTNHDRDAKLNGVNGARPDGQTNNMDKGKAAGDHAAAVVNGDYVGDNGPNGPPPHVAPSEHLSIQGPPRMNDLPDEIIHITQGFVPLSALLTRLAQTTHNSLQEKVTELAKMPIPANALNGNAAHSNNAADDLSSENIRKKASILAFAQEQHAKWVKALVITEWSRKSEMVSKLIDLNSHITQQRILYDAALDNIVNVKRDLTFARMPSPDLKTALQVLSTGTAPWMPDLNYIELPELTSDEQIKWVDDVNTLLSLRLNLEDYDKIPYHFRNYEIDSGRVTFKVPGEFEVDLTIADEDFEKQFWFIDFRFAFTPSASTLPESVKRWLEGYINDALGKDGLSECYKLLHEFVLTHKLNELKRQALQLSKSSWTGTLKVEPLNRALAIQYWTSRTPPTGPKSWVLVAVNSGRKKDGQADGKSSSFLEAKWYRDNKAVKDVDIPLDVENLSAEGLLKTVVGRHIDFILSSIHDKFQVAPRFRNRQARMDLRVSQPDPANSCLDVQVGYENIVSLLMEPMTGVFAIKPHSKFSIQFEGQLNNGKNPAEDGVSCLERIRCSIMEDELIRRGGYTGWSTRKCPLNNEELRSAVKIRDVTRTIWLQRDGWGESWFVMVLLSLSGDEWWLLEANRDANNRSPRFQARLPLNNGYPLLSNSFWNHLTLFTTGMIAQSVDLRELHRHHIKSRQSQSRNWSLPQPVRLPSTEIALSGIFPTLVFDSAESESAKGSSGQAATVGQNSELASILRPLTQPLTTVALSAKQPWANDIVSIVFKGVQPPRKLEGSLDPPPADTPLTCVSDAIIKVRKPSKFASLKGLVDREVSYHPQKGEFCLRIRHGIGESVLTTLKSRVKAVDRFVNFLESMDKAKGTLVSEKVTLRIVTFSYSEPRDQNDDNTQRPPRWRIVLDLSKDSIDIKLQRDNPHLRVIDLMKTLVNSDGGIEALMLWLPTSLPALSAIQRIETTWADIQAMRQGYVEFSMKSVDWMSIRYTIAGSERLIQQSRRQLTLDVKIKVRRGEPWWNIYRVYSTNHPQEDEFTTALKPIWEGKGHDWHGLITSVAARPSSGIVDLLTAVDDAIRALVGTPEGTFVTDLTTQNSSSQSMQSFTQPTTQQSQGTGKGSQVVVID
ncbi:Fc.00g069130.m01.CDS01 [Cosmosporella sp. VM-42]